jgi:hypothetical protein
VINDAPVTRHPRAVPVLPVGPTMSLAPEVLEGWCTDPYARHVARWMSAGNPTDLVRDGRQESRDPVTDGPYRVTPVPIVTVPLQPAWGIRRADDGLDPITFDEDSRRPCLGCSCPLERGGLSTPCGRADSSLAVPPSVIGSDCFPVCGPTMFDAIAGDGPAASLLGPRQSATVGGGHSHSSPLPSC